MSRASLGTRCALKEKIQSLEKELGQILGASTKPVAAVAQKKKRKMSAAVKASIVAAQKARWAKIKAAKPAVKPVKAAKPAKKKFKNKELTVYFKLQEQSNKMAALYEKAA